MISGELKTAEDSDEHELLRDVVKSTENDLPKRRRISVNQFKIRKSQHCLKKEDYFKNSYFPNHSKLRIPHLWQSLARRTLMLSDPFRSFKLTELKSEHVVRYIYNSITKSWKTDQAVVKMEKEPFNRGAMRECFRLKKISQLQSNSLKDWSKAGNYVCKRYMENVTKEVYFEDVRLQMDAKLWAEEFNRQSGIKKEVDIFRMCIIEFVDREEKPLYHLERFIEGTYIKYNSNSGFVDEHTRNTPQAFSHFTFERSGHELIVVDIQGVGDLYTDPQIHTSTKNYYGNGNLGTRGMALFFHTHKCNKICRALGLAKFDLSPSEERYRDMCGFSNMTSDTTADFQGKPLKSLRNTKPSNTLETALLDILEEHLTEDPIEQINNAIEYLETATEDGINHNKEYHFQISSPDSGYDNDEDVGLNINNDSSKNSSGNVDNKSNKKTRFKYDSPNSFEAAKNGALLDSYMSRNHVHRASCAASTDYGSLRMGESILGEIHHEMASMHESGRFFDKNQLDEPVDWEAVLYHEDIAASLNCMDAMLNMSHYFLGLPARDLLQNCLEKPKPQEEFKGWFYLTKTAEAGYRPSIMCLADSNDVRQSVALGRDPDWNTVMHYLEKSLDTMDQSDYNGEFDATNDQPSYVVKARMASMLHTGGYGLEKNLCRSAELYTEAADEATAALSGRLASKYYELAEQVYEELE